MKTTAGEKIKGKLISFNEDLVLEIETKQKKKKESLIEKINIPIDKIKETKLIIKFK